MNNPFNNNIAILESKIIYFYLRPNFSWLNYNILKGVSHILIFFIKSISFKDISLSVLRSWRVWVLSKSESVKIYWLSVKFDWFKYLKRDYCKSVKFHWLLEWKSTDLSVKNIFALKNQWKAKLLIQSVKIWLIQI